MSPLATRTFRIVITLVTCLASGPATNGRTTAVANATTPELCGDLDADGDRTVTEGVLTLRTAAGLSGGCQVSSRCDVDGNGAVTVTDGVAVLRLAAGLPVTLNCRDAVVDRSSYAFFSFTRRSAFGFCPPLDSLSRVFLNRSGDTIEFSALLITEGTPGSPDCLADIDTVPPVECAVEIELPERTLTPDEVARVDAAFSAITFEQQRNPDCAHVTFDPCLINEFAWDTSVITDFVCGEPRLLPDQSQALIDVLESLR